MIPEVILQKCHISFDSPLLGCFAGIIVVVVVVVVVIALDVSGAVVVVVAVALSFAIVQHAKPKLRLLAVPVHV